MCGEENKPVKFIKEVVSCPKEWPEEGKIGNRVPKEGPLPAEAAQAGPSLHLEQHGCGQNAERMVYGLCARLLAVLVAPYSTPIQALSVTGHTASQLRALPGSWQAAGLRWRHRKVVLGGLLVWKASPMSSMTSTQVPGWGRDGCKESIPGKAETSRNQHPDEGFSHLQDFLRVREVTLQAIVTLESYSVNPSGILAGRVH